MGYGILISISAYFSKNNNEKLWKVTKIYKFVTCHSDVYRETKFAKTPFSSFNSQEYQIGFTLGIEPKQLWLKVWRWFLHRWKLTEMGRDRYNSCKVILSDQLRQIIEITDLGWLRKTKGLILKIIFSEILSNKIDFWNLLK